jgi:hypothetical protein
VRTVRWEDHVDRVLDDLEQQAEGLALAERDGAVAEQRVAEYAAVDLAGRLLASLDRPVRLGVPSAGTVEGVLRRVGRDWVLVDARPRDWVVRTAAVLSLAGVADRFLPDGARPVTARLGLGSALRGVAEGGDEVLVHRVGGGAVRGRLCRVGADFVELAGDGRVELVPFGALVALVSVPAG